MLPLFGKNGAQILALAAFSIILLKKWNLLKKENLFITSYPRKYFFCKDYFVAIIFWWQICFWQNLYGHLFLHTIFFDKIFFLAKFYLVKFFSSIPLDCFIFASWACMLNLSFRNRNFMVEENKRISSFHGYLSHSSSWVEFELGLG